MTLRKYPAADVPVVVTRRQRDRLTQGRPSGRTLDADGVRAHLRRCWAALKPPPPPNPVSGERPGYVPPAA